MRIGIGIPNTVPGAPGQVFVDWARRAEERGFSTLATIGRVAYPGYDEFIVLTAAGAVTQKIKLLTNVLVAPTRSPALLAKEAASLAHISNGRFILGAGVGGREDDFAASGQDFRHRGQRWDETLDLLHRAWQGEAVAGSPKPITPGPGQRADVPILIGGSTDATITRTIKYGIGWTAGGGSPQQAQEFANRLKAAWKDAGKPGAPQIYALTYFGLGPNAEAGVSGYIGDYYSFLGPWAAQIAQGAPKTPEAAQGAAQQFADAGIDELIFVPAIAEVAQVDLLADAVLKG